MDTTSKTHSKVSPDPAGVYIKLLRALALGGKHSSEIQLLLDSEMGEAADFQNLALVLTGMSVRAERAKITFEKLRTHQTEMQQALGRPVMVKTAAMDFLERIEAASDRPTDEMDLSYDQLVQMAFRDHLTDLSNYRHFSLRLGQEMLRARRYKHLLSLLMFDLDRFKVFNDTFGHAAGNQALIHLAGIIREELRETDLKARYGGEEFAIILPETTKQEAAILAENLRARIESSPVMLDEGPQTLTVSLGVATFWRDANDAADLISNADQALYASKSGGRNRVTLFEPLHANVFSFQPGEADVITSVSVVGEFNGWDRSVDPLQCQEDGHYELAMHLAPGRYAYKFVINDEHHIADPGMDAFDQDGYGGCNSILVVND